MSFRVLPLKRFNHSAVPLGEGYLVVARFYQGPGPRFTFWRTDADFNPLWEQQVVHGRELSYDPRLFFTGRGRLMLVAADWVGDQNRQVMWDVNVGESSVSLGLPRCMPQFQQHEKNWIPHERWWFYDFDRGRVLTDQLTVAADGQPQNRGLRGGTNVVVRGQRLVCLVHHRAAVDGDPRVDYKASLLVLRREFPFRQLRLVPLDDADLLAAVPKTNPTEHAQKVVRTVVYPTSLVCRPGGGLTCLMGVNDSATAAVELNVDPYL